MPFFRLDDSYWSHPKMLALSVHARDLWTRAGSYCMQHLTDGLLNKAALTILGAKPKQIAELVDAGLWVKVLPGYQFHDWEDYQDTADRLKDRRDKARERMRNLRANQDSTDSTTSSSPVRTNKTRTDDARSSDVPELAHGLSIPVHPSPMAVLEDQSPVPETSRDTGPDPESATPERKIADRLRVDFDRVAAVLARQAGDPVPAAVTARIIRDVINRARPQDGDRTGVVIASVKRDWAEWSRLVFQVAS